MNQSRQSFELDNAKLLNQLQNLTAKSGVSYREFLALKSHRDKLEVENQKLKEEVKRLKESIQSLQEKENLAVFGDGNEENSKKNSKIAKNINKLAEKPEEYIKGLVGDIDRVIAILNEY
jgi:regulator of replication initiation timing